MAWKPRFPFRGRKSPPRNLARAVARKANKRFTWVEAFNVTCTPQVVECLGCNGDNSICCRANFGVVVLNQSVNELQFSDECTVVAMRGYITIMPQVAFSGNPDTDAFLLDTFGISATMGLRKDDITTKQPLGAEYDLLDTGDYTESKQRRTWEHHQWPSRSSLELKELGPSQVIGCCSNVTGSISGGAGFVANGITWTATAGAIDTSVTGTITTDCGTPCITDAGFSPSLNGTANTHRELSPWKWNLNSRKHFKVREDEELKLNLSLGYFDMFNGGNCPPPNTGFLWMGRLKVLVSF